MQLHSLAVRNFRGIQSADWKLHAGLNCLIGPGNSTKSTLLSAVDLLLTSRSNVSLTDADFHDCDVSKRLVIEGVVTDVPRDLANIDAFGLLFSGLTPGGELRADPEEDTTPALVIRFSADDSLEGVWEVVKRGTDERTKRFFVSDRRKMGLFRVDDRTDQHLRWSRYSHLSALSDSTAPVSAALADAHRTARAAIFGVTLASLKETADDVALGLTSLGGDALTNARPGLDPGTLMASGSIVLHDGEVPLANHGIGMRRLVSLSVQRLRSDEPSLLLVDEIEHGLEPHRLARVLAVLRDEAAAGVQTLITTHSPSVVEALACAALTVVRSDGGNTTAMSVPESLEGLRDQPQRMVRSGSSAMLARRVLVVEGATEEGLLRALCEHWDTPNSNLATVGSAIRQGGNDAQALENATVLADLGYPSAAMIDNDKELDDEVAHAKSRGALVMRCADGLCLERHLIRDLPEIGLPGLLDLACELRPDDPALAREAVLAQVSTYLSGNPRLVDTSIFDWPCDVITAREAVGLAAAGTPNRPAWFKSNPNAYALGTFVIEYLDEGERGEDSFWSHLDSIRDFLYS